MPKSKLLKNMYVGLKVWFAGVVVGITLGLAVGILNLIFKSTALMVILVILSIPAYLYFLGVLVQTWLKK